jgi:rhombotail lipoprotein
MHIRSLGITAAIAICASLAGCALLAPCTPYCGTVAHNSSSLVQFLYPGGTAPPPQNQVPVLHIPLRIGLAFLPATGTAPGMGLSAAQKEVLLERIQQHFSRRRFVAQIVLIPDYYLAGARGFESLQGVQRLYDVDLMALVSYDQVMHQDLNGWSIAYWTIAGAYVIKGNRYDVTTLVDLAVIDPATRSLVLRAGGTDSGHGSATAIAEARELRASSGAGFTAATDEMIAHFDTALDQLQAQVHAGTADVRVVSRNGSAGGGGSFDWIDLILLLPFVALRLRRSHSSPS